VPNYIVFFAGTLSKAELADGRWVGTSFRRVTADTEQLAIDVAAADFGQPGRYVAVPYSAVVSGRIDESRTFAPVVVDP
jgi:hypothetical protein